MGFSIELDENIARRLQDRAATLNVDPEELGRQYVRDELDKTDFLRNQPARRPDETDMEFFDRMVREMREISSCANAPTFPDEVMTRDWIYADHD